MCPCSSAFLASHSGNICLVRCNIATTHSVIFNHIDGWFDIPLIISISRHQEVLLPEKDIHTNKYINEPIGRYGVVLKCNVVFDIGT